MRFSKAMSLKLQKYLRESLSKVAQVKRNLLIKVPKIVRIFRSMDKSEYGSNVSELKRIRSAKFIDAQL